MKKAICLLLICFPALSYSQKRKGYSRIYPSYTIQNYFDQNSIKFDGLPPEGHIHAQNTIGHNWGLQYERVTHYGLILSAGLQYGIRRYDISIKQDMSTFDPEAINNLKGVFYSNNTKLSVNYWTYRMIAGYRMKLNNKFSIIAKGGVSTRFFYDGNWDYNEYSLDYDRDNGITSVSAEITDIKKEFGRDPSLNKHGFIGRNRFPKGIFSYEMYVGVERDFDSSVIKNVSIGIEGCRNWFMWLNDGEMTIWTSPSVNQILNSREHFYDRNISLGLRVAVGLWK